MTSGPRAAGGAIVALLPALLVAGCSSSKPKTDASFCALAKSEQAQTITFSQQFSTAKPADLKPVVEKALAQLSGFDAAAPPAIAGATHTYVTDERNFLTVIKVNGYDVTKSLGTVEKSVQDPAFMRASQQLSAYLTGTCHLSAATAAPSGSPGG